MIHCVRRFLFVEIRDWLEFWDNVWDWQHTHWHRRLTFDEKFSVHVFWPLHSLDRINPISDEKSAKLQNISDSTLLTRSISISRFSRNIKILLSVLKYSSVWPLVAVKSQRTCKTIRTWYDFHVTLFFCPKPKRESTKFWRTISKYNLSVEWTTSSGVDEKVFSTKRCKMFRIECLSSKRSHKIWAGEIKLALKQQFREKVNLLQICLSDAAESFYSFLLALLSAAKNFVKEGETWPTWGGWEEEKRYFHSQTEYFMGLDCWIIFFLCVLCCDLPSSGTLQSCRSQRQTLN